MNLYSEKQIKNLNNKKKNYILLSIIDFIVFIIFSILIFVFTNRSNLLSMEIISIIISFMLLSVFIFIVTCPLYKTVLRIKLINFFSKNKNEPEIVQGKVNYLKEKRKFYSFTFIKVEINNCYYYIEDSVALNEEIKAKIKNGFIIEYE